ncbi:hypothetical protein GR248_01650 [Rhizobium leguminosarum]|uniref:hypothetical protein n=1 Tax=Rhizobium leguminosarum TaxID=384 RepID=UPI0013C69587|nr:hypothetical protein [Rhizobium leguminosarum]NEI89512.1 hypothetical protein [Rhizobium leguminosarum]
MSSKIGIAFVKGGIIPAAVMKKDKDVTVPPHEAIDVPEGYGLHLIADKFAYAKSVEKKPVAKSSKGGKGKEPDADQIADAEQAVATAQAELDVAGGDLAAKAAAEQNLEAAKAALAALKA